MHVRKKLRYMYDILFIFQGSTKLTKEDIERVFALYDRVSQTRNLLKVLVLVYDRTAEPPKRTEPKQVSARFGSAR